MLQLLLSLIMWATLQTGAFYSQGIHLPILCLHGILVFPSYYSTPSLAQIISAFYSLTIFLLDFADILIISCNVVTPIKLLLPSLNMSIL
jgi:hypothetical protein